jgi:hypothetical protein
MTTLPPPASPGKAHGPPLASIGADGILPGPAVEADDALATSLTVIQSLLIVWLVIRRRRRDRAARKGGPPQ